MNAPALLQSQRGLQAFVLGAEASAFALNDERADASRRLQVYRDAYRLRLLEVLRNDYPLLHQALGDIEFARVGERYIKSHPPRHYSARWFGRDFAASLGDQPVYAELADFEWAQGEAFDAADAPVLSVGNLADVPADAWPDLQLQLHPSLRRLELHMAAAALTQSPQPMWRDSARAYVIWRRERQVLWRELQDDEAAALDAARRGETFEQLCETLCQWCEPDAAAMRAAGLLKRWLVDGLIAGLRT